MGDDLLKKLIFLLIVVLLFISIGAVSAEGNFTSLKNDIDSNPKSVDLTQDYVYDNNTDDQLSSGIVIDKDDFVVNGNGHTIDGSNQARIFALTGDNITLKNLNLINGNSSVGGAVLCPGFVNFENVTFKYNTADKGAAIGCQNATIVGSMFVNNNAINGVIYSDDGDLGIVSSSFVNSTNLTSSIIYALSEGSLSIEDCEFLNSHAKYATAIYSSKDTKIKDTVFKDLSAEFTAGAVAFKGDLDVIINNTVFINTTAKKNGGAIFADFNDGILEINNMTVLNSSADFGGAICQLGGYLIIDDSVFTGNTALYDGGAIYSSYANFALQDCLVSGNKVLSPGYSNGGGVYLDMSEDASITDTIFENNAVNGLYCYDSNLNMSDCIFKSNGEAIHCVFSYYEINNVTLGNDTVNLNDTNYVFLNDGKGIKLELLNNSIIVDNLPSRFDSRDWGWVTSVKNQGNMGSCWTFGNCGALESALLKATGIAYDFSENNMQNSMLQYSKYGIKGFEEGGAREQGLVYILSWLGVFPTEYDSYDELGKISPLIETLKNIHIQDAVFVPSRKNATDNDKLKRAIIECGSVTTGYYVFQDAPYYNKNTSANYQMVYNKTNHAISLVGWDDNYSAENFMIEPPGDGAFIIKNSWGNNSGDNGYNYISYYDTSLLNTTFAIGYIIENTENYTKNYQTDFGGYFYISNMYDSYEITYESQGNDLISAVGTYFKENEDYVLEIYVNDKLVHTQNGTSPFYGFHTVKLTKEIPVKINDTFTAVMKKESCFLLLDSRQHYLENMTFANYNGTMVDLSGLNRTASLKVYTKDLVLYTEDLVKVYKNESQFYALINASNEKVTFEINGNNYTRTSDENCAAKMNINLLPGNYTIKTSYGGVTVENNIVVLPTLIAENLVKYFRNESQFYISLIDGESKLIPNATITMNINGVFYNRTTNENGTAKLNINLNPGVYILTAVDPFTGLQMSYNITVLPVLTAEDVKMTYLDGTQFKATLVDGQGNPLAGALITFNINGVLYNRTTDENGIAKLNIRLMAGEYIITSQYGQARISNKITISS